MFNIEKPNKLLPQSFTQLIEKDLNQCIKWLPNVLEANFEEIIEFRGYQNAFEFLVGLSVGKCQGKYLQIFEDLYERTPSFEQTTEIRETVTRRKMQFEHGVNTFLGEKDLKRINSPDNKNDSIWMQTPLQDFGFKCMMNKHDLCTTKKCECLCHYNK